MKATTEDSLKLYLRGTIRSNRYGARLAEVFLSQGTWFRGRAESNDYEVTKQWRTKNRPRMKRCYYNAQMFCCDHDDGRYFEGYAAISSQPPLSHAWVVMPDGRVVDFTFEAMERSARRDGEVCDTTGALYLGVEVPRRWIVEAMQLKRAVEPVALTYYLRAK